jgi:GNAT superfamily N-acetyltransferase
MLDLQESRLNSAAPVRVGDFILRPPLREEVGWYVELGQRYDQEVTGTSSFSLESAAAEWDDPHFDYTNNFRFVIDAATGKPAAYGEMFIHPVMAVRPWGFGFVAPEYRGRGIGTLLAKWTIERATSLIPTVPANARVVLQNGVHDANKQAAELLTGLGFLHRRSSYTMMIHMEAPPPAPVWPDGITLTDFRETPNLRLFAAARNAGFRDHRGFIEMPIDVLTERWQRHIDADTRHDPELLVLAQDGTESAGLVIGEYSDEYDNTGWIDILAVMPAHRRRGLGLALLHHAFGLYWSRGIRSVGLGVDGASLTNAVALYERAGMHIDKKYDVYELELRSGEELTPQ